MARSRWRERLCHCVIPVQAGIHSAVAMNLHGSRMKAQMDSRSCGDDE